MALATHGLRLLHGPVWHSPGPWQPNEQRRDDRIRLSITVRLRPGHLHPDCDLADGRLAQGLWTRWRYCGCSKICSRNHRRLCIYCYSDRYRHEVHYPLCTCSSRSGRTTRLSGTCFAEGNKSPDVRERLCTGSRRCSGSCDSTCLREGSAECRICFSCFRDCGYR